MKTISDLSELRYARLTEVTFPTMAPIITPLKMNLLVPRLERIAPSLVSSIPSANVALTIGISKSAFPGDIPCKLRTINLGIKSGLRQND